MWRASSFHRSTIVENDVLESIGAFAFANLSRLYSVWVYARVPAAARFIRRARVCLVSVTEQEELQSLRKLLIQTAEDWTRHSGGRKICLRILSGSEGLKADCSLFLFPLASSQKMLLWTTLVLLLSPVSLNSQRCKYHWQDNDSREAQ